MLRFGEKRNSTPGGFETRGIHSNLKASSASSPAPMHLRTPSEKADLEASWLRPDREFFSAGACHILAGAFLGAHPASGFVSYLIHPASGFRGGHVLVIGDEVTFDWLGYQPRADRLARFERECRTAMPGWSCSMVPISDPLGWPFCRQFRHRHPSQFHGDVMARAHRFRRELEALHHRPHGERR